MAGPIRWWRRLKWRRSKYFERDVCAAADEVCRIYGAQALEVARRKYKRRNQPVRRKWVWREVVVRLEAEQSILANESQQRLEAGFGNQGDQLCSESL